MTDVRCDRCKHKLFVNENGSGSVLIKCTNCKLVNRVRLDSATNVAR